MEITVRIPGLEDLIDVLEDVTKALDGQAVTLGVVEETVDEAGETPVSISLETVRAKLAALSQAGKQAEVRALISQFGATRLTDIPSDKFPELMEAAEGL